MQQQIPPLVPGTVTETAARVCFVLHFQISEVGEFLFELYEFMCAHIFKDKLYVYYLLIKYILFRYHLIYFIDMLKLR
jgi:hypothetical protein